MSSPRQLGMSSAAAYACAALGLCGCAEPSPGPAQRPGEDPHVETADATSTADEVPLTDIYLGRLNTGAEPWTVTELRNVTAREGYDNQPHFTPDGAAFYYTSVRDGQSDIYRYAIADGLSTQVTDTPANEYSPTPLGSASALSVVRELGGVQQLWRYGLGGEDQGQLFTGLDRVGYHLWLGADWAAFFLVGEGEEPHRLVHARDTGPASPPALEPIADGPGRCIAAVPGEDALAFYRAEPGTEGEGAGSIMRYVLASGALSVLAPARPGSEDYAFAPDGSVLMAEGDSLWRWRAGEGEDEGEGWAPVSLVAAEGAALPRAALNRLTVHAGASGAWIALVEQREP